MADGSSNAIGLEPLARVSEVLDAEDAEDLRWYLRSDGGTSGGMTTFGIQLEQAKMLVHGSRPCKKCGGNPKTWKPGTGFAPKSGKPYKAALKSFQHEEAKRLKIAIGTPTQIAMLKLIDPKACAVTRSQLSELFPEIPPLQCISCPKCHGRGVIQRNGKARARGPITARPTGSSKHGRPPSTGEINEMDIQRCGRVSRKLRAVRAVSEQSAMVLETYYSPDGGALVALWHLTGAGRTLLKANKVGLYYREFFSNERDRQRSNPTAYRRALFDGADKQAKELLRSAGRIWNETTGDAP